MLVGSEAYASLYTRGRNHLYLLMVVHVPQGLLVVEEVVVEGVEEAWPATATADMPWLEAAHAVLSCCLQGTCQCPVSLLGQCPLAVQQFRQTSKHKKLVQTHNICGGQQARKKHSS